MKLQEHIKAAIKSIGFEGYYITRGTNNPPCVVYNYTGKPKSCSDNRIESMQYTVLFNILSSENIISTNELFIKNLIENGFRNLTTQTTLQEQGIFFNTPIKATIIVDI